MERKSISAGYILAKQKLQNNKKPFTRKRVNAAAQKLGRLGGLKGGPARAEAMSSRDQSLNGTYAVLVRWGKIDPLEEPFEQWKGSR